MSKKLVKDRLEEKLSQSDLWTVKQALYTYLARHDPQIRRTKFETLDLVELLPALHEVAPQWTGVTKDDLNTALAAISSMYHCVRNQFKHLEILRGKLNEFMDELTYSEDQEEEHPEQQPMKTRAQEKAGSAA